MPERSQGEAAQLRGLVVDLGATMHHLTSYFATLGSRSFGSRGEADGPSGASRDDHRGLGGSSEVRPVSFRGPFLTRVFAGCAPHAPAGRPAAGRPEALVLPGEDPAGERGVVNKLFYVFSGGLIL